MTAAQKRARWSPAFMAFAERANEVIKELNRVKPGLGSHAITELESQLGLLEVGGMLVEIRRLNPAAAVEIRGEIMAALVESRKTWEEPQVASEVTS